MKICYNFEGDNIKRYSVIDIGSNTVKLSVFEIEENGIIHEIAKQSCYTKLVNYNINGIISNEGIIKLVNDLCYLKKISEKYDSYKTYVVATEAIRSSINREKIVKLTNKKTGFNIIILTGIEEAELTFASLLNDNADLSDGLLFDIGGGSTELISFRNKKIDYCVSYHVGALNLNRKFVTNNLPNLNEKNSIDLFLNKEISKICFNNNIHSIYINGGSGIALKRVISKVNKNDETSCSILNFDKIKTLLNDIINREKSILEIMKEVIPERFETLPMALCILDFLHNKIMFNDIIITDSNIRKGLIYKISNGN